MILIFGPFDEQLQQCFYVYIVKSPYLPDAGLDFTQAVFVVGEGDGSVDVCMELTPPSGGMECEVVVNLLAADNKAGN